MFIEKLFLNFYLLLSFDNILAAAASQLEHLSPSLFKSCPSTKLSSGPTMATAEIPSSPKITFTSMSVQVACKSNALLLTSY